MPRCVVTWSIRDRRSGLKKKSLRSVSVPAPAPAASRRWVCVNNDHSPQTKHFNSHFDVSIVDVTTCCPRVSESNNQESSLIALPSTMAQIAASTDNLVDRLKPFLAGSITGIVTKTSTAPLERVKTLMQVEGMKAMKSVQNGAELGSASVPRASILRTFSSIYLRDGLVGMWYGNFANCLRVVPVYALKFGFNYSIKDAFRTSPNEKLSYTKLMASGTLAGLMQTCVTYPLETIRTRLTVGLAHGLHYDGIWHCIKDTFKFEGITGFYKGLTPTFVTGAPYVGLQMSSFEVLSREAKELELFGGSLALQSIFCGALGGIFAQTITYPGDTVRKRLQTDGIRGANKVYRGMFHCAATIARTEGVRTFFAGLGANVIRGIPGAAIQFSVYSWLKRTLLAK
mgnify:FL=1